MYWYEREEQRLEDALNRGDLTLDEFNEEMLELQRDARAELEERAQRAADDIMGGW